MHRLWVCAMMGERFQGAGLYWACLLTGEQSGVEDWKVVEDLFVAHRKFNGKCRF